MIERHEKKRGNIDICVADEAAIKAAAVDPVLSKDEGTPPIPRLDRTLSPLGRGQGEGTHAPSLSCGGGPCRERQENPLCLVRRNSLVVYEVVSHDQRFVSDPLKPEIITILPVANGYVPALYNHSSLLIHPAKPYLPNWCGLPKQS